MTRSEGLLSSAVPRPSDLDELIAWPRSDVLSVALDIDPGPPRYRNEPPAWRIWLRNELRALLRRLPEADRAHARPHAERVQAFLEHERPRGRGLALFAGDGLWRGYVLPVPLRGRVRHGRPDVLPLLWALGEHRPYGILAVNRERALLLAAYLGGTSVAGAELLDLTPNEWRVAAGRQPSFTRRAGTGASRGIQRDTFEARVEEQRRRLWLGAAEAAARWLQETGVERLIIAGPEEAAKAVRRALPEGVRDRLVAIVPARSDLDPEALHRVTAPVVRRQEQARMRALVERIVGGTRGGTVVGLEPTLEALARRQVLTLVADRDVPGDAAGCGRCGHVAVEPIHLCPACGGPVERTGLAQVLPLIARRSGARLEPVAGDAADRLRPYGGIGAVLRYTVVEPPPGPGPARSASTSGHAGID